MFTTDYTPGDAPLEAGTLVLYKDGGDRVYRVLEEPVLGKPLNPQEHPNLLTAIRRNPENEEYFRNLFAAAYPDGKVYCIWPVDVPRKFGNRNHMTGWVRRESLRVHEEKK